jgi:simple sugar transport system substrate-binding protein
MGSSDSGCTTVGCLGAIVLVILAIVFVIKPHFPTIHFGSQTSTSTTHRLKFAVITDGEATDPFWSAIKHGVDQASKNTGVITTYQAPNIVSVPAMSRLIDRAIATKPDGLIVSIPDCSGLTPAIKRAELVGIPVISINSGNDCASKLGLLNHVGQTAYQLGLEGGQKLVDAGAKHVLCVNQEVGNSDFDDRCRGINDAMAQAGRKSEVLAVDLNNPYIAQQIQNKLTQNSSIDAVMTLSPVTASLAITTLQQPGLSHIMLATFDLSSDILQDIQQGTIVFAIDRKPDLQGSLPIMLLTQYKKNAHDGTTPITTTDASFVTKDNVADTSPYVG